MTSIRSRWESAWKDKLFRRYIICTLILLIVCALAAPRLFDYVEKRPGFLLPDPLLDFLPSADLSVLIFTLLYLLIGTGASQLLKSPEKLLLGLQAYLFITVMRFITLLLVPLDPPPGLLELHDPFIDRFLYQQSVTKDLFFSGHTGTIALFFFLLHDHPFWRKIFLWGTLLTGSLLLVQHAHYTIDVLVAPGFAWAAVQLARVVYKRLNKSLLSDQFLNKT